MSYFKQIFTEFKKIWLEPLYKNSDGTRIILPQSLLQNILAKY